MAPLTPQRGELVCELASAPPFGGLGGLFKQLLRVWYVTNFLVIIYEDRTQP